MLHPLTNISLFIPDYLFLFTALFLFGTDIPDSYSTATRPSMQTKHREAHVMGAEELA